MKRLAMMLCAVASVGCSPAQLAGAHAVATTVAQVTCQGADLLARECRNRGLAPSDPCPLLMQVTPAEAVVMTPARAESEAE